MKSKFRKAEITERYWLSHLTNKHNKWAIKKIYENDYNYWDANLVIDFLTLLAEIKIRTFAHTKYADAILEKSKVDKIMEQIKINRDKYIGRGQNLAGAYLAVYPASSMALLFNIANWTGEGTQLMPRTTMGNREMVMTPVYYYNINTAIKLEL